MSDNSQLVSAYMSAFASADVAAIERLLTPDVVLQDPVAGVVEGRDRVLSLYAEMFKAMSDIRLRVLRRYDSDGGSAQEFELCFVDLDKVERNLSGVDLFECRDSKICALRAYLDTRSS